MLRIFVHEQLSGHDAPADEVPPALLDAGTAMRDALLTDLLGLHGLRVTCAVGSRAAAPAHHPHLACTRALPGERARDFVHRVAWTHDACWVVAPETGGLLVHLHDAVAGTAAQWIGCRRDALRVASSKRATLQALSRAGVPTPLDLDHGEHDAWVVKPDDGAGTLDTRVHDGLAAARRDLVERQRRGSHPTLEPHAAGEPLSVTLLAGPHGPEVLACNRQRIERDADGRLHDHGVLPRALDDAGDERVPALRALARDVVRALPGLRGLVGIDVVWHAALGPLAIEVNPRATEACIGLSGRLGRNMAGAVLAAHGYGTVAA